MSILKPTRLDIEYPKQIKKYSAMLRLWHWSNIVVISGSLVTVLINSTLFEDKILRSDNASKSLIEALEDKIWGVHIYFGYALAALFLFRIMLEFFQHPEERFFYHFEVAYRDYFILKHNSVSAKHELMVRIIYLVFYGLLVIMAISGLILAFEDQLGLQKPVAHQVKEFHGFCMYLILVFILVHLTGVFIAERKNSKGIVSDMINGGKHA